MAKHRCSSMEEEFNSDQPARAVAWWKRLKEVTKSNHVVVVERFLKMSSFKKVDGFYSCFKDKMLLRPINYAHGIMGTLKIP